MMRAEYHSELISRPRRKRRLFWFLFGSFVVLVVVLTGGFYALRNLAWFKVTAFDVSGTSLPEGQVVTAVKIAEISRGLRGLLGPQNILFWQFGKKPDVSLSLPLIASLRVEPDLFARRVEIVAADRTLWGVVCGRESGNCYGIDASGTVFARVPQTEGVLILKIEDSNDRAFVLGEPFLPRAAWLWNFMDVLSALDANGYPVASINIDDFGTNIWHAVLAAGETMDFSFDFVPNDFAAVLAGLKTKLDLAKVTDIDFSVPQRIYYK